MSAAPAISVSVVICVYTLDRLWDALEAIASAEAQTHAPVEIIMVVDHNPVLRAELIAHAPGDVILVDNDNARGLSGARNTGFGVAKGDVVFFLDDDAIADPECLARSVAHFTDPNVIGVGGFIAPRWANQRPDWFPSEFLWTVGCTYDGMKPGAVRNMLGAAMCIRRSVFAIVGGFDDGLGRKSSGLPLGCEETEFCIRAAKGIPGARILFEPAARVMHKVPASRMTWRYFARRCYAEGLSKSRLSRLVGSGSSLSNEKSFVTGTLLPAVATNVAEALKERTTAGLKRSFALGLGLASAALAYAKESAASVFQRTTRSADRETTQPAAPVAAGGLSAARIQEQLLSRFRRLAGANYDLFSNAGLFALGTAVASALGFIYWLAAAQLYPASAVGFAAGAMSLMNFFGHVGELGLGAYLMGELHRFQRRPGPLLNGALLVAFLASSAFACLYLLVGEFLNLGLGNVVAWASGNLMFLLGCALTGLTLVVDQSMVGLLASQLQVFRNLAFAVIKLVLLAAAPFVLASVAHEEVTILSTWVIGQLLSVVLLFAWLRRTRPELYAAPEPKQLQPFVSSIMGHHLLNLASLAPGLLLPFIVTVTLSATTNAAFFAAWMLINVAYLAPASLASVLYTVGTRAPHEVADRLTASLVASLAASAAVALGCALFSDLALGLFNAGYPAVAGSTLALLGLSMMPTAIKYHYVAIQRIRGRTYQASLVVTIGCVFELVGAIAGGLSNGLFGLAQGWLICLTLEAALMMPAIMREVRWNGIGFAAPLPAMDRLRSGAVLVQERIAASRSLRLFGRR